MFSLKILSKTAFQKYQDPNHHLINSTLHFPTHNLSNWQSQFLCTPKFHKNLKGKRPRAIFCHMLLCYSPTLIPLCDCFSLTKWLHCSHWWFCFSICSEVPHTLQDILYHLAWILHEFKFWSNTTLTPCQLNLRSSHLTVLIDT